LFLTKTLHSCIKIDTVRLIIHRNPGPSRRLASQSAHEAIAILAERSWAAALGLRNGTVTHAEWRQAVLADLAARAAAEAIELRTSDDKRCKMVYYYLY
jgi:hypothetical protein